MRYSNPASPEVQQELAKQLYKYQNFRGSLTPQKIKSDIYQESSIVAFHSIMRRYLNTGVKDLQRALPEFYDELDKQKSLCVVPLRPSEDEKARPYTCRPRKEKSNVRIVKPAYKAPETSSNSSINNSNKINISSDTLARIKFNNSIVYGLQVDSNLKMFESKDMREGYMQAYRDIDPTMEFKKVKLILEVEE